MLLIALSYFAGVLTLFSPCILPVLPFVFARSESSFVKGTLPILAGMSVTFTAVSALALLGGTWISTVSNLGRTAALVMMTFFGLSMIFPKLMDIVFSPLSKWGERIGRNRANASVSSSFIIGVSTGLLWAPCAGPILGLVLTTASTQKDIAGSASLLFAYSLGAATALGAALAAGGKFFKSLKKSLGVQKYVKTTLGVLVLLGVAMIALKLDQTLLTKLSKIDTTKWETRLLEYSNNQPTQGSTSDMKLAADRLTAENEGPMPELDGAGPWLNSKPLTLADLKGKVVLIDFWTYSCINCLRTLPFVKTWAEKYQKDGLVVIGVHTPEFGFEKEIPNVTKALKDLGIGYPVAIDNEFKVWNAFHNQYWPAHYFIDRKGMIRKHHFGEGNYEESEATIRKLLAETSELPAVAIHGSGHVLNSSDAVAFSNGIGASPAATDIKSLETYIGYSRAEHLKVEPEVVHNKAAIYSPPASLGLNDWSLKGKWIVKNENAVSQASGSKISFRFHARDLHLVLGANGNQIRFRVRLDGKVPGENHGVDTATNGEGMVQANRLYQLIRQTPISAAQDHTFEIEFLDPGVEAFAFTFG